MGVPGRRRSLGGFTGAFRFLGWVNLQPNILETTANLASSPIAEELFLQHLERLVALVRTKVVNTYGAGYQIGQLQSSEVGSLVGENDVKRQRPVAGVVTVANAPELQFQLSILLFAASLHQDVRFEVVLFLLSQELAQGLKANSECDVVWI